MDQRWINHHYAHLISRSPEFTSGSDNGNALKTEALRQSFSEQLQHLKEQLSYKSPPKVVQPVRAKTVDVSTMKPARGGAGS